MALWMREQSLLTQKGKEILSKLQVGVGRMEVTRIVSGAGYVATADLENQTQVKNPKQEFTITAKETTNQGSGLEINLKNDNLLQEYNLYQIGVYVTHTDYADSGGNLIEMLYMLAQCSTSHPDLVPAFDDMPMELSYSIYLYHSNIVDPSMVTINVNMAGYIPLYMRGRSLGIAPLDLDGNVPADNLPSASITSRGTIQLADTGEIDAGLNNVKAVTPYQLKRYTDEVISDTIGSISGELITENQMNNAINKAISTEDTEIPSKGTVLHMRPVEIVTGIYAPPILATVAGFVQTLSADTPVGDPQEGKLAVDLENN